MDAQYIPLITLPKSLLFDLDVSLDGKDAVVVNSSLDCQIAAEHLVRLARQNDPTLSVASDAIHGLLEQICHDFPEDPLSPTTLVSEKGLDGFLNSCSTHIIGLLDVDRKWLIQASCNAQWKSQVELYSDRFILTIEGSLENPGRLVKIRRSEAAVESSDRELRALYHGSSLPIQSVAFFDLKRTQSTHLRVPVPERMFISDPYLTTLSGDVNAIDQSTSSKVAFYLTDCELNDARASFFLWPEERDFVTPSYITSAVTAGFMLLVGFTIPILHLFNWILHAIFSTGMGRSLVSYNVFQRLFDDVEAATALLLIIPTTVVSLLSNTNDNDLRWQALRYWRVPAIASTLPLVIAAGLGLFAPPFYSGSTIIIFWLVSGFLSLYCFILLRSQRKLLTFARRRMMALASKRVSLPLYDD